MTALSSNDIPGFQPAYSMPAAGSADAQPPEVGNAAFPGTLQRVARFGTFTAVGTGQGAQLDLVAGQFLPGQFLPGQGTSPSGTQRLFTSITSQVYYLPNASPYAQDFAPPTILATLATPTQPEVDFTVQVAPAAAPVQQVFVLYTDAANPGTWHSVTLSPSSGQNWTGSGTLTASGHVQYIAEALDAAGNVAVSNNEGTAFSSTAQSSVAIALAGNGPVNGDYTGPVTVEITAPSGSTYAVDSASPGTVGSGGTASVTVSSSGEHTVVVTGSKGRTASESFAISNDETKTTLSSSSPAAVIGQSVTLTGSVSAATPGQGQPTGDIEFFDGSTPVGLRGGASGAPIGPGGTASCTVSYGSAGDHQFTASYVPNDAFSGSTSMPVALAVNPRTATVSSFTVTGTPALYGFETSLLFWTTVTAGDHGAFPGGDTLAITAGALTLCTMALTPGTGAAANSGSGSCHPSSGTILPPGTPIAITGTFNSTGADPRFAAALPATTTVTVGFSQACITAAHSGSLSVAKGQSLCIGVGGKVTGSVSVSSGGALYASGGSISGSVSSSGAVAITLCGVAITGSVSVAGTSGPTTIGGSGCPGDRFGGSVSLTSNQAGLSLQNSQVTGSLSVSGNSDGVAISGDTVGRQRHGHEQYRRLRVHEHYRRWFACDHEQLRRLYLLRQYGRRLAQEVRQQLMTFSRTPTTPPFRRSALATGRRGQYGGRTPRSCGPVPPARTPPPHGRPGRRRAS